MRHNSRRSKNRNNNGGNHGNNHNGNQGRRGNNVPPRMQVFDSNGPDVRIRGTAWQVHEKYLALAKDASSSGDTIMAENYLQHAEHYQRIINTFTEQMGNWAPPASHTDQAIDLNDSASDTQDADGNNLESDNEGASPASERQASERQARPRRTRTPRRAAESADVENDEDLGLPASMLRPTNIEKITESA